MFQYYSNRKSIVCLLAFTFFCNFLLNDVTAREKPIITPNNFGLPGIIDLPTAKNFPDGELVVTQQVHETLARTGISFQALPRIGFAFRYSGHGIGGEEAYGRVNHDRSFDAHISLLKERKNLPAVSLGLRDFIGTGWYSSEYFVATKSAGKFELTAGIGFGRLAGRNAFSNPLSIFSSRFDQRDGDEIGKGGTLGSLNWFQGEASAFYGFRYELGKKIRLLAEYTPDLMSRESEYLELKSPWNFATDYQLNNYLKLSAQYLHGSQISLTGHVKINPNRPPLVGGRELAPVPMRLRVKDAPPLKRTNVDLIRKVLSADRFQVYELSFINEYVNIVVKNTKFRSTAQALGRIASTLQRFTSDDVTFANISFLANDLITASYIVDLDKTTFEQFGHNTLIGDNSSIKAYNSDISKIKKPSESFSWGLGPYFTQRLFNPDLPLSMELGLELEAGYRLATGLKISGSVRKSVLTNLTKNKRLNSGSILPRVHSNWPLYDLAGQNGHIHSLKLSYVSNLAPGIFGRIHAGLLEPFFAGIGGELLYKSAQSPLGIGIDIHHVRQRDYDMKFDLQDYKTTLGHISLFYDAGGMFDIEINAGRYLAGDWGATTSISRKFGSGWEVGGYATLTDIPFNTFGEGSFDKAIYVSIPIDWIVSTPNRSKRKLTIRPITRDGGAQLSGARQLYQEIENFQNASVKREIGRLWK